MIEGIKYVLTKGDIFFYTPYQNQHYYADKDEPWDVKWVHFYGKELKEFLIHNHFHSLEQALLDLLSACNQYKLSNPTKLSILMYAVLTEFTSSAIPLSEALN